MTKELIIQPYDALISVGVGPINSQLKGLSKRYNIVEVADNSWLGLHNYQYSEKLKRNIFYVFISNKNTDKKKYWNTVSHEILHLTQSILEHKGIYFKKGDPNESYTYLMGYIMGELFEFFEKEYNKINK